MSKFCTSCNVENSDEANFCLNCGNENFNAEDMTELDMFFSDKFTESQKEEFTKKKNDAAMVKRIKELDDALQGSQVSSSKKANNSDIQTTGNKILKYFFAIITAIIILMIASVIFQLFKNGFVEIGQNIYNNYGSVGTFFVSLFKFSPLIVGIWLVKVSWNKIIN